jgi:alanine-glyoxylate transaminase/serine-glyoxylate transaminase/serine-pyruvate transaminase
VDSVEVRKTLLERYGIEVSPGSGEFAKTVWRIGLMGHNARLDRAEMLLGALRETLGR